MRITKTEKEKKKKKKKKRTSPANEVALFGALSLLFSHLLGLLDAVADKCCGRIGS